MARLIDADKIYNAVERRYQVSSGIEHRCERDLLDLICAADTVDAVEVVRCKDCKYYCQDKINGVICRHPALDFDTECFDHWINTNPDDFCSYGELKEGAD